MRYSPFKIKACDLVASAVDWSKVNVFGAISQWHLPILQSIIKEKKHFVQHLELCPAWERPLETIERSQEIKFIAKFMKPGMDSKTLDPKFAELVNNHWKFRDDDSLAWIKSQCAAGFGVGVFLPGVKEPVSWIMSYR